MNATVRTVAEIVAHYRAQLGTEGEPCTLRAFADALNDGLPVPVISHQSVANWESGQFEPAERTLALIATLVQGQDWRLDFVRDLLALDAPEVSA